MEEREEEQEREEEATPQAALVVPGYLDDDTLTELEGVPPEVLAECEEDWRQGKWGLLESLARNRDRLAPYGKFKEWCEAHGLNYHNTVRHLSDAFGNVSKRPGPLNGPASLVVDAETAALTPSEEVAQHSTANRRVKDVRALDAADPEDRETVTKQVASGDGRDIGKLLAVAKSNREKQERLDREPELRQQWAALDPNGRSAVYCCEIQYLPIADGVVDLMLTDPDYRAKSMPTYSTLAEFAFRKLKPGGSLLAVCGNSHLPEALWRLGALAAFGGPDTGLVYHCIVAWIHHGPSSRSWEGDYFDKWKPVLWFTKGEYTRPAVRNLVHGGGKDKQYHEWGQDVPASRTLIRRYSEPNGLVVDGYVGGGTTAEAAYCEQRRFIGGDSDESAVATTLDRMAERIRTGIPATPRDLYDVGEEPDEEQWADDSDAAGDP
jgi:hypothetical protein